MTTVTVYTVQCALPSLLFLACCCVQCACVLCACVFVCVCVCVGWVLLGFVFFLVRAIFQNTKNRAGGDL
jgi:hypothetical protein